MYSKLMSDQKTLLKVSYVEAMRLGATDPLHAVSCAAFDVLVGDTVKWNGPEGQDAFAAALAFLVIEKVVKIKGPVKHNTRVKKAVETIARYYDYPNIGWWELKKARAKRMTLSELDFARRDCNDTARNGMPENQGKYTDEATIYAEQMRKRVGEEVQGVH